MAYFNALSSLEGHLELKAGLAIVPIPLAVLIYLLRQKQKNPS